MKGFKDFILKGNLIELAVAFIMGTAFAAVVKAFAGVLMDLVGKIFSIPNFSGTQVAGINLGDFLTALVSFLMISLVLYFVVIKPYEAYKKMRGIKDEKSATEAELLTEIRDLLAGK